MNPKRLTNYMNYSVFGQSQDKRFARNDNSNKFSTVIPSCWLSPQSELGLVIQPVDISVSWVCCQYKPDGGRIPRGPAEATGGTGTPPRWGEVWPSSPVRSLSWGVWGRRDVIGQPLPDTIGMVPATKGGGLNMLAIRSSKSGKKN